MSTAIRILLIEDSLTVSGVLQSCLENEGHRVRLASSIADALGTLREEGLPDLMLMDVGLPDVQGDKACERLRQASSSRNIPVVLVSGLPRTKLAAVARSSDADAYFNKEQPMELLLGWIEAHAPLLRQLGGRERLLPTSGAGVPSGGDVLLVYPETPPREAIRTVLARAGWEVRVCQDLAGSAALMRERRPAGVILDVGMPGVEPELACGVWRMRPGFEELPVLLLIPEGVPDPERMAFEVGAQAWLQRPCSANDLLERFNSAVVGERPEEVVAPPTAEEAERFRELAKGLGSPDAATRLAALRSLEAKVEDHLPAICGMLQDDDLEVRLAALQAMRAARGRDAVAALVGCLAPDRSRRERLAAVRVLGEMGDHSASDALQGILFEEDPELQDGAREALDRIDRRDS